MESGRVKKKLTADERFAYKLCLAFGGRYPHPDYLLADLTWEQFAGWLQYHNEDPWGESRADHRALAYLVWQKANVEWPEETWPEFSFPYRSGDDPDRILGEVAKLKARKMKLLSGEKPEKLTKPKQPDCL